MKCPVCKGKRILYISLKELGGALLPFVCFRCNGWGFVNLINWIIGQVEKALICTKRGNKYLAKKIINKNREEF